MKHVSVAEFRHSEGNRLIDFWRAAYSEHQITPREPEPGLLIADAGFAEVRIAAAGAVCRIEIACDDATLLPDIRTGISTHMEVFDAGLAPLEWSGAGRAGTLPPTLSLGEVTSCRPFGRSWWRMRVRLPPEGFARFSSEEHWHFRLLRPVEGNRSPVWPRLAANGTVAWPKGCDRLTNCVFTVRASDAATGEIVFDIFRHPGGPTGDWAATPPLGQTIGLMGPGAKGGPTVGQGAGRIVAGGDETAVPAILRGLEGLPAGATGHAFLLVGGADDVQQASGGPAITWLLRSNGATEESLISAVRDATRAQDGVDFVWFAASKNAARVIRTGCLESLDLPKERVHAVGYWS